MSDDLKRTPTGHLRRHPTSGHLVYGCAGCCETCPTDCSGCADHSATLAGFAGTCLCCNGTYALTRGAGTSCIWSYAGPTADGDPFSRISIDLRCTSGNWTLTISAFSVCSPSYLGDFVGAASLPNRAGTDDCGRLGVYTITAGGTTIFCGSSAVTATVS